MNNEDRVRQQIQRRMGNRTSSSLLDNSRFLDELDSDINESSHSHAQPQNNYLEGQQLQAELKIERQKLHAIEGQIDKARLKMVEVIKEEDGLKEKLTDKRKEYAVMRSTLEQGNKESMAAVEQGQQAKKEEMFKKIDQLLQTKNQLLGRMQKIKSEVSKASKRNQEQLERNKREIKSYKEVFMASEREKRAKWEKTKVDQIKEQAVRDTEPKLLAIIKSANDDKKKAEEDGKKQLEEFKQQYKIKLQKDLTEAKTRLFDEGENEKQELRIQLVNRVRERVEQRERQLEEELRGVRDQYNRQIREEEHKIRQDVEEFILRNRDSHSQNIDEIRQLQQHYESEIRKMTSNTKQRQEQVRAQFEEKEKRRFEQGKREVDQTGEQKLDRAKDDIKKKIDDSMARVVREIEVNKTTFLEDINQRHEHQLITEKKNCDDRVAKERENFEAIQKEIGESQTKRVKEEGRTQQLRKDRNQLSNKNEELERKIKGYQAELMAFQRLTLEKEKQSKDNKEALQKKFQRQVQDLKTVYFKRDEEKKQRQDELIEDYEAKAAYLSEQLLGARNKVEEAVNRQREELRRTTEERQLLAAEVEQVKERIEARRKHLGGQ